MINFLINSFKNSPRLIQFYSESDVIKKFLLLLKDLNSIKPTLISNSVSESISHFLSFLFENNSDRTTFYINKFHEEFQEYNIFDEIQNSLKFAQDIQSSDIILNSCFNQKLRLIINLCLKWQKSNLLYASKISTGFSSTLLSCALIRTSS